MMSAGVCGFASALSAEGLSAEGLSVEGLSADACAAGFDSGLDLGAGTIWASAEASCSVAAIYGFARGVGTASATLVSVDFAGTAAATTAAGFSALMGAGALASSSSSLDLPPLNSEANR